MVIAAKMGQKLATQNKMYVVHGHTKIQKERYFCSNKSFFWLDANFDCSFFKMLVQFSIGLFRWNHSSFVYPGESCSILGCEGAKVVKGAKADQTVQADWKSNHNKGSYKQNIMELDSAKAIAMV